MATQLRTTRPQVAGIIDLLIVLAFIVGGRASHSDDPSGNSLIAVAVPYLVGLAVGWVVLWRMGLRRAMTPAAGLLIAANTWAIGTLTRRFIFGGGTAFGFLLVSALFLFGLVIGWRVLAGMAARRAG
ncbi:MAG: DUF3054 domain-containing protein [Candidatus Nanopelagicales bacterium]